MKGDKTNFRILEILKWEGPSSQENLAKKLELSTMAVSKHLTQFLNEGLVEYEEKKRERGRPVKYWKPTAKADEFFPNSHAGLAVSLLESAHKAFGDDAVATLLNEHTSKKVRQYMEELEPFPGLEERVQKYAEIRHREGYLAECQSGEKGEMVLIENHCPVCDVAKVCQEICESELSVMKTLFGLDVHIQRTEHIQNNERRCAYSIVRKS